MTCLSAFPRKSLGLVTQQRELTENTDGLSTKEFTGDPTHRHSRVQMMMTPMTNTSALPSAFPSES